MSITEQERCKRAIAEIRKTIGNRLKILDEQFVEPLDSEGNCDSTRLYAEAMTDLVFDVVDHAVSYTEKVRELEVFRDRLHDATHTLDIAISVLKGSEYKDADWHRKLDELIRSA